MAIKHALDSREFCNVANISFNVFLENKMLWKISEFTVQI